jgi:hypothetical protein
VYHIAYIKRWYSLHEPSTAIAGVGALGDELGELDDNFVPKSERVELERLFEFSDNCAKTLIELDKQQIIISPYH